MGTYSEINRISSSMAKDICHENENYVKNVNKIASKTAEYAVTAKTGNEHLGKTAGVAMEKFTESFENEIPEFITSVGIVAAASVGSMALIVALPFVAVGKIWESIFED